MYLGIMPVLYVVPNIPANVSKPLMYFQMNQRQEKSKSMLLREMWRANFPDAYTKACEEENEMGNIYHCKKRGCKEYPRNKKAGGKTDPPTSYEVIPFSHK